MYWIMCDPRQQSHELYPAWAIFLFISFCAFSSFLREQIDKDIF